MKKHTANPAPHSAWPAARPPGRGILVLLIFAASLLGNRALVAEAPMTFTVRVTNGDDDPIADLACSVNSPDHSGFTVALPPVAPGATVEVGPLDAVIDPDGYQTVQLRWWDPDLAQYHYSEPLRLYTSYPAPTVFAFNIPPSSDRRVLIFAPHPDDEALGTAGLIYYCLHGDHPNHARVRVVLSTNGDAYTSAVSNYYYGATGYPVTAMDFRNSGLARRLESLQAMALLGLTGPADVLLLNYPDQGMPVLFASNYNPASPWTSSFTQVNEKYDPDAYRSDATPDAIKYAGANVHQDMVSILSGFQPTEIYVTDPRDTHKDHAYTYVFVDEAVRAAGFLTATMYRTIIHSGMGSDSWPNPTWASVGGVREARCTPTLAFALPTDMPTPDAVFDFAVMSPDSPMRRPDATNLKRLAIDCYRSQIGWYYSGGVLVPSTNIDSHGYLIAFTKSNELFWTGGYDGPDGNDWPASPAVQTYDQTAASQLSRLDASTLGKYQDIHDVWRLPVPQPGRIRFRLDVIGSDFGLRLYDRDGRTLLATFEGAGSTEQFEYAFRVAGAYYVEVFIQGGNPGGSYSFNDKTFSPPIPGDFDWNWRVDGADFGLMQACALGPAVPYGNPPVRQECELTPDGAGYLPADFDRDADIDQDDFGTFQRCYGGPDIEGDPTCAG